MAGSITVSSITLDSDNNFSILSNTGATLFFANTTGIDVANSIGATAITNDKILSVANTKISGNIISSQITSVANTQISGNIASSQITSNPTLYGNVSVTGVIAVGGATPTTNGSGITFPATQSASSDANTLDDYEEGTWTPSVGGNATYTTQSGTYTKVGNIVTAWFDIQINVLGTGGTGNIQGLPYVSRVSPSNPQGMAGMVGYFVNIATASTLILVRVDNNTTTASLSSTAGVTTNVLGNAIYGNSARTTGTIIYQANA